MTSCSNQIWVADITCIPTREGWLSLAGIMDPHSRRIVGWAMSPSIDSALVLSALSMATLHRQPTPGVIFHSDRGVLYAAGATATTTPPWKESGAPSNLN